MWSYPGARDFKLRGQKYLRDRKKVGSAAASLPAPVSQGPAPPAAVAVALAAGGCCVSLKGAR